MVRLCERELDELERDQQRERLDVRRVGQVARLVGALARLGRQLPSDSPSVSDGSREGNGQVDRDGFLARLAAGQDERADAKPSCP
jgi:hypothetical protein